MAGFADTPHAARRMSSLRNTYPAPSWAPIAQYRCRPLVNNVIAMHKHLCYASARVVQPRSREACMIDIALFAVPGLLSRLKARSCGVSLQTT
jgi:hypothetical protein